MNVNFLSFQRVIRMAGDKDHKDAGDSLPTIADDLVVTKYKMAAEIVNSKSGFTVTGLYLPYIVQYNKEPTLNKRQHTLCTKTVGLTVA